MPLTPSRRWEISYPDRSQAPISPFCRTRQSDQNFMMDDEISRADYGSESSTNRDAYFG